MQAEVTPDIAGAVLPVEQREELDDPLAPPDVDKYYS